MQLNQRKVVSDSVGLLKPSNKNIIDEEVSKEDNEESSVMVRSEFLKTWANEFLEISKPENIKVLPRQRKRAKI